MARTRLFPALALLARWGALAALALVLAAQLVFFVTHAAQILGYPYPLDYGEGPLLAQVSALRAGTPFGQLYANPDQPPYAVVNYPPVYHLASALLASAVGDTLLAGRLVALAATLAALAALWLLSDERRQTKDEGSAQGRFRPSPLVFRLLIVLSFLAIPIVREWAVAMRVDLLGVALGLWGLALLRRGYAERRLLGAALALALSLLVKPSLVAAPAAALLWLLFRDWRRALRLGALLAVLGGLAVGLLQLGSGGWFWLHVVAANANPWQRALAYGFWHDQLVILWPLGAAGVLGTLSALYKLLTLTMKNQEPRTENRAPNQEVLGSQFSVLLPVYYALFGALVAFGVGKVGAYTNYFLEFYAGLVWLAALTVADDGRKTKDQEPSSFVLRPSSFVPLVVVLLVAAAQLRYYPAWSETYLKLAGIIEGKNPPRLTAGRYGVWQDLRREREILAALGAINQVMDGEVRAAAAPILTDVPGLAAQSGQLTRLQAFEYRQLLDAGLADQRALLRDMANGRVPLVALDYLGNWLTPELITLITHRYAQDGSRGTYDIYRPVEPGPRTALRLDFPPELRLLGYHRAPAVAGPSYHAGETVLLTLEFQALPGVGASYEVVVQLADARGNVLLEYARPLLYGALPPAAWGGGAMQHLHPLALPAELLPMDYQLLLTLRAAGRELAQPRLLARLAVGEQTGRQLGERGYYVPAPLLEAWRALDGDAASGPGDAIMPAVPFAGYTLQCFTRACLKLVDGRVERVPLGELVLLGEAGLQLARPGMAVAVGAHFAEFWQANGRAEAFGPALTPEVLRFGRLAQYLRYARIEQRDGGVGLAPLGEEYLRLPGGVPYRWPGSP